MLLEDCALLAQRLHARPVGMHTTGYPVPRDVLGRSCLVSVIRHCAYQRVLARLIVSRGALGAFLGL